MVTNVIVSQDERTKEHDAFSALLEESFSRSLNTGQVVVGEILRIEKDMLIVDIGGKCEGHVPFKEIPHYMRDPDLVSHFKKGEIRDFYVLREFDEDAPYTLSLRRVETWKDWQELSNLKESNTILEVEVCNVTRGGVLVQVRGLKGFIPASQLRIAKTLDALIGEVIPAKLLEVDRTKNKLILSHRAAVFEAQSEKRQSTLNSLSEEQVVTGSVVKITNFGAFVDVNGIDGLLPLSEISWRRLSHPSDELKLGQTLEVQVLSIDKELERISLSKKRLSPDPWTTVQDRFEEGSQVSGQVSKLLNSGFLVELEPGVEAFCGYHREVPRDSLKIGETHTFNLVSIAQNDRRITLQPLVAVPAN